VANPKQMPLTPDKMIVHYGDIRVQVNQDGWRHAEGVSFLMANAPGRTINGVPESIAATLADFEDEQGRTLIEQQRDRLADAKDRAEGR
jgi:hypothetical protein